MEESSSFYTLTVPKLIAIGIALMDYNYFGLSLDLTGSRDYLMM